MKRLLLCSAALICFFPSSPASSFDPLSDHPLDDSLTAKEIKYIGLTLRHQCLAPHLLPPLLPEAVISPTDKRWIGTLSLHSHQYPFFLPSLLPSFLFFPPFLCRVLIPASRWMHVTDVIPLFNMLFWAPTPPQTQSLPGLHAYSSALKNKRQITLFVMYHISHYSILSLFFAAFGGLVHVEHVSDTQILKTNIQSVKERLRSSKHAKEKLLRLSHMWRWECMSLCVCV